MTAATFRPPDAGVRVCTWDGRDFFDLPVIDPCDGSFVRPGVVAACGGCDPIEMLYLIYGVYQYAYEEDPTLIICSELLWRRAVAGDPTFRQVEYGAGGETTAFRGCRVSLFPDPDVVMAFGPVSAIPRSPHVEPGG